MYLMLLIRELPALSATVLGSLSVSTCSIHCPTAWRVLWHTIPAAPWQASSGWTHGSSEQLLHRLGTNTVKHNPDSYEETGQRIEHKEKGLHVSSEQRFAVLIDVILHWMTCLKFCTKLKLFCLMRSSWWVSITTEKQRFYLPRQVSLLFSILIWIFFNMNIENVVYIFSVLFNRL